jgi:hypothetical protein
MILPNNMVIAWIVSATQTFADNLGDFTANLTVPPLPSNTKGDLYSINRRRVGLTYHALCIEQSPRRR